MSRLPIGWVESRLESVCEISSGFGFPTHLQGRESGDFPFAKVRDISETVAAGAYEIATANHWVTEGDLETLKARPVPPGSTIFAKIGEAIRLQRRALTARSLLIDNNVMALSPLSPIEPRFIFHWFRGIDLYSLANATTVPSVRKSDVSEINVALPPLNEQRRIVAKLEALQERTRNAREALEAIPPLIEKFRQSILAAAFRGDLTADWRAKNPDVEPASLLLDRIRTERRRKWEEAELAKLKARGRTPTDDRWKSKYAEPAPIDLTGLPELPEGWGWASLDEITLNRDGERIPLKQSDRAKRSGEFPYYGASGIIDHIDAYLYDGDYLLIAEDGANLLSRSTPIAFHARGRFWVNNHAHVLQGIETLVTDALRCYVNGANLGHLVSGSAQPKLTQKNLNKICIPLAPISELSHIIAMLSAADRALAMVDSRASDSTDSLNHLESSILAEAFRGELVPQDPNDEPASVLLERIRAERAKEQPKAPRGRRTRRARTEPDDVAEVSNFGPPTMQPPATPTRRNSPSPSGKKTGTSASSSSGASQPDTPRKTLDDCTVEDILIALRRAMPRVTRYERDDVIRNTARVLGFDRTGSRIRETIESALPTAARRHIISMSSLGLWIMRRDITDYPRDDLKQYFLAALGPTWQTREDAIRAATRHLGFARVGKNIEATWKSVINGLIRTGHLETDGDNIRRMSGH